MSLHEISVYELSRNNWLVLVPFDEVLIEKLESFLEYLSRAIRFVFFADI